MCLAVGLLEYGKVAVRMSHIRGLHFARPRDTVYKPQPERNHIMKLLTLALITSLSVPAFAESIRPNPPKVPRPPITIIEPGTGIEALAGIELPTVAKGETSWSIGLGLDGGIGVGLQHGIADNFSVYIKAAKADGESAVGFLGIAGKF